MSKETDANRQLWDSWTPIHKNAGFYDLEGLKDGKTATIVSTTSSVEVA